MDSLDFNNHVIDDKFSTFAKSQTFDRIRVMGNLVRLIDVCFVLLVVSCSSVYLPMVVKMSSEFISEVLSLVSSTHAIFVIGNVIIIALVAQSGKFSRQSDDDGRKCVTDNVYDEYVENSESKRGFASPFINEKIKEEKHVISSEKLQVLHHNNELSVAATATTESSLKPYRRTQSDTFERSDRVLSHKELRRSETEINKRARPIKNAVDQLSNEEFQRRIEAFIEKQQRFLRDEYLSIVVADQNRQL